MAHAVETRTQNPATILRERLSKAERLLVSVQPENVEEFLLLLDQIEADLEALDDVGMDLRPEHGRWEGLLRKLSSSSNGVVAAARAAGGMAKLRAAHPPAESFWWHLDAELARRRRNTLLRIGGIVGGAVGLVVLVIWGLYTFFPPDPETIFLMDTTNEIESLVMEQRWDEALQMVETGQARMPDAPELLLWETVIAEQVGDGPRAQQALDQVLAQFDAEDPAPWINLGNYRLQAGNLAGAEEAAQAALERAPDSAQATFLLAGIADAQGDVTLAIDLFDRTFLLAQDSDPQLAVIARVRMGQLMQAANPFESPPTSGPAQEPAPTPAP